MSLASLKFHIRFERAAISATPLHLSNTYEETYDHTDDHTAHDALQA